MVNWFPWITGFRRHFTIYALIVIYSRNTPKTSDTKGGIW